MQGGRAVHAVVHPEETEGGMFLVHHSHEVWDIISRGILMMDLCETVQVSLGRMA